MTGSGDIEAMTDRVELVTRLQELRSASCAEADKWLVDLCDDMIQALNSTEGLRDALLSLKALNQGVFDNNSLSSGQRNFAKLCIDKIDAALSKSTDIVVGWRDVETDPPPLNEMVLAWCPKHRLVLLERHKGRETETWAVSPSGRMDCPEPTHWQPLPAPPEAMRSVIGR